MYSNLLLLCIVIDYTLKKCKLDAAIDLEGHFVVTIYHALWTWQEYTKLTKRYCCPKFSQLIFNHINMSTPRNSKHLYQKFSALMHACCAMINMEDGHVPIRNILTWSTHHLDILMLLWCLIVQSNANWWKDTVGVLMIFQTVSYFLCWVKVAWKMYQRCGSPSQLLQHNPIRYEGIWCQWWTNIWNHLYCTKLRKNRAKRMTIFSPWNRNLVFKIEQ